MCYEIAIRHRRNQKAYLVVGRGAGRAHVLRMDAGLY